MPENCKNQWEQASRLFGNWKSPGEAVPHTGETPVPPGQWAALAISANAPPAKHTIPNLFAPGFSHDLFQATAGLDAASDRLDQADIGIAHSREWAIWINAEELVHAADKIPRVDGSRDNLLARCVR